MCRNIISLVLLTEFGHGHHITNIHTARFLITCLFSTNRRGKGLAWPHVTGWFHFYVRPRVHVFWFQSEKSPTLTRVNLTPWPTDKTLSLSFFWPKSLVDVKLSKSAQSLQRRVYFRTIDLNNLSFRRDGLAGERLIFNIVFHLAIITISLSVFCCVSFFLKDFYCVG